MIMGIVAERGTAKEVVDSMVSEAEALGALSLPELLARNAERA